MNIKLLISEEIFSWN